MGFPQLPKLEFLTHITHPIGGMKARTHKPAHAHSGDRRWLIDLAAHVVTRSATRAVGDHDPVCAGVRRLCRGDMERCARGTADVRAVSLPLVTQRSLARSYHAQGNALTHGNALPGRLSGNHRRSRHSAYRQGQLGDGQTAAAIARRHRHLLGSRLGIGVRRRTAVGNRGAVVIAEVPSVDQGDICGTGGLYPECHALADGRRMGCGGGRRDNHGHGLVGRDLDDLPVARPSAKGALVSVLQGKKGRGAAGQIRKRKKSAKRRAQKGVRTI